MAFIRRLDPLQESGHSTLNFLWKDDARPIYVMDNHRGALWCWLRELRSEDEYSLIHIDWHWDAAAGDDDARIQAAEAAAGEGSLTLDGLLSLTPAGRSLAIVRWDNYIAPLPGLRPQAPAAFLTAPQPDSGT